MDLQNSTPPNSSIPAPPPQNPNAPNVVPFNIPEASALDYSPSDVSEKQKEIVYEHGYRDGKFALDARIGTAQLRAETFAQYKEKAVQELSPERWIQGWVRGGFASDYHLTGRPQAIVKPDSTVPLTLTNSFWRKLGQQLLRPIRFFWNLPRNLGKTAAQSWQRFWFAKKQDTHSKLKNADYALVMRSFLEEQEDLAKRQYLDSEAENAAFRLIQPTRGRLTAWVYLIAGFILMASEFVMAQSILGTGYDLHSPILVVGKYQISEAWLFALGVIMITFLIKYAYDRLVELPWVLAAKEKFRTQYSVKGVKAELRTDELHLEGESFDVQADLAEPGLHSHHYRMMPHSFKGESLDIKMLPGKLKRSANIIKGFKWLVLLITVFVIGNLVVGGIVRHEVNYWKWNIEPQERSVERLEEKLLTDKELRDYDAIAETNSRLDAEQYSLGKSRLSLNEYKKGWQVQLGFIGLNILFPLGSAICLSISFGMISRARRKNHLERKWRFWNSSLGYFARMDGFLEDLRKNLLLRYEYIFHSLSKVYLRGYALGRSRRPYMDLRDSIVNKHKLNH